MQSIFKWFIGNDVYPGHVNAVTRRSDVLKELRGLDRKPRFVGTLALQIFNIEAGGSRSRAGSSIVAKIISRCFRSDLIKPVGQERGLSVQKMVLDRLAPAFPWTKEIRNFLPRDLYCFEEG